MTNVDRRVRSVLAAPRGRRFSRPGAALSQPVTRQPVPEPWETWEERRERLLRQMEVNPGVTSLLGRGEVSRRVVVDRPRREPATREARQKAVPRSRRGRHRAPCRWWARPAMLVSAVLLFGQAVGQSLGEVAGDEAVLTAELLV